MKLKIMLILALVFSITGVIQAENDPKSPTYPLNDGGPGW